MRYYVVKTEEFDEYELSKSYESEIIGYTDSSNIADQYSLANGNYEIFSREQAVDMFGEEYVVDVDNDDCELEDIGIEVQYVYDVRVKSKDISNPATSVNIQFYFETLGGNIATPYKKHYNKDFVVDSVYVSTNEYTGDVQFEATVFFISDKKYTVEEAYKNFKDLFVKLDDFILQNRKVYENLN